MDNTDADAIRRRKIGAQRRDRTRKKLLVAGGRVVAQLGEKKATIDDFIQAAGVARGTFYNYYSTKNELLEDLWASVGRDPFRSIELTCANLADPAERLATRARLILAYAATHGAWGWLVYALSADAETVNKDLMTFPRPDLTVGRSLGVFKFANLDSASDLVVGAVRRGLNAVLAEQRDDDYADQLCSMILRGLGLGETEVDRIVGTFSTIHDATRPGDPPIIAKRPRSSPA